MSKRVDMATALNMIQDGDCVAASGFLMVVCPRGLYRGIANKFLETGHPRNLTLVHAAGNGNNADQGIYEMSYEGLVDRYITGHFSHNARMVEMANTNKVKAYNFPQGVISHLWRAIAGGKVGEITKIGLGTYCDPRQLGGKMNDVTTEDLVQLVNIDGQEQLLYKLPKLNIGLIRGTTADENGNISMEEEVSAVDTLDIAMAVKAQGGKVIVQVKNYVSSASMERSKVVIPGSMVDAVVVCENPEEDHRQTVGSFYNPVLAGHYRIDGAGFDTIPLTERKIIARRAAMELTPNTVINLGIGMPEGVSAVVAEEGMSDQFILTVESGLIGGVPTGGKDFGGSVNAWAGIPATSQFDYYNGGNLSLSCLGCAEVDAAGNVNVSKFGPKLTGCGGFIDISQSTKTIVFCGTMTASGLKIAVQDGKLVILQEGKMVKFKKSVEQVTFSAEFSQKFGQRVLFVTERCVFEVVEGGLRLSEVAPGIDIEKDILPYMEFTPIIPNEVPLMDARIFADEPMDLQEIVGHRK